MAPPSEPGRDVAGVIAPPPLIFGGFLVLGLVLNAVWPLPITGAHVASAVRYAAGAVLGVAGIVLGIAGFLEFRRAGTDVRPERPTTALVTTGPFRLSRNPLYISQVLFYLAIAVAADSGWALALIVPTIAVIRFGVIAREEAYLERRFGEDYRRYKAVVRRWL